LDDPGCDDEDATTPEARAACEAAAAAAASGGKTFMAAAAAGPDFATCTRGFTAAGSQPRSLAIILAKWPRNYYKSEADCCAEQGNAPGCGCKLGSGFTWENLPPPSAYSRLLTDECDDGPSINRAFFDASGGRVTFHSKLRVPVPAGRRAAATATTGGSDDNATDSTTAATGAPTPTTTLSEAAASSSTTAAATAAATEPVSTPTSYQDPLGVDVYGWALLKEGMRTGPGDNTGECRDWCGDAMAQLGVNPGDYDHIVCNPLYASRAICDTCSGDGCSGTCPASTGITTVRWFFFCVCLFVCWVGWLVCST
jgi:hypothetical protein